MGLLGSVVAFGFFSLIAFAASGVIGWVFGRELRDATWTATLMYWFFGACICSYMIFISLYFSDMLLNAQAVLYGLAGELLAYTLLFATSASISPRKPSNLL
jgi:hypothetical protein